MAQRGLSRDPRDILGNVLTFPQSHPPPTFLTMTLTCSSEASPTAGLTGLKTFAAPCKAMVPGRVLSKLPGHLFEKNTPSLGVSRVRGWPLICSDARPEAGTLTQSKGSRGCHSRPYGHLSVLTERVTRLCQQAWAEVAQDSTGLRWH